MRLEPCPGCERHVRVEEAVCPFCGADVVEAMSRAPARTLPRSRLSRAALIGTAFAAVAGGSLIEGCGDDDPASIVPHYGRPPIDASTLDSGDSQVNSVPPYGLAPLPLDASTPDAGDADADANFIGPALRDASSDGQRPSGDPELDSGTHA